MKTIRIISSVLLLYAALPSFAQRATTTRPTTIYVPQTIYQGPTIDYKYHDGVAMLTDGTLLKGRFQTNGRSFTYHASSQATRQKIGASMIRRLALAGADTLVTDRKDSTIFVRLGHRLYRQLAGGSTLLLDQKYTVDEDRGKVGARLFALDENEDFHKFTSLKKLNNWFYGFQERSGKKVSDAYLNESEIIKAVAQLNNK